MNGKIILKTPFMCECCILIDRKSRTLNPFKKTHSIELPYGKHYVNVGINYDQMPESSKVHSANTWAWDEDKEVNIGEQVVYIKLKRKWHLLKPVTALAEMKIL